MLSALTITSVCSFIQPALFGSGEVVLRFASPWRCCGRQPALQREPGMAQPAELLSYDSHQRAAHISNRNMHATRLFVYNVLPSQSLQAVPAPATMNVVVSVYRRGLSSPRM